MKMKNLASLVSGLAVTMAACTTAVAVETWDMANEYNESSLHAGTQLLFAKIIDDQTDGDIRINHHFGGAMGYSSQDHFDAVGDGALQLANTNITTLGGINPIFLLSSLPFLVRDTQEARKLWELAKPVYAKIFEDNNQILLWSSPWTPAGLWSKTEVNNNDDFKKLKIRTWDTNGTQTIINAGSSAVQLNWGDVVPQLATGGIDAVLTSTEGGANAKFWEHLKFFTPLNYSMSLNVSHMNKDVFDSLSDDRQQLILKAAAEAEELGWQEAVKRQNQNIVDMKAHDVTVAEEAQDELLDLLAEASQPILQDWLKRTGASGKGVLEDYQAAVGR